jgi:hypothetical protein
VELSKYFESGWTSPGGKRFQASQVWIDSGWHEHTDPVYMFCETANASLGLSRGREIYRPSKGYGEGQRNTTRYIAPTTKRKGVIYLGDEFHIGTVQRNGRTIPGVMLVHMNADHWKSELHQRLMMPEDEHLSVTLYEAASFAEHAEFTRHLTAEKQVEKFIEGRGEVIVWDRIERNNHWLDSTYASICAGEAILSIAAATNRQTQARPTLQQLASGR